MNKMTLDISLLWIRTIYGMNTLDVILTSFWIEHCYYIHSTSAKFLRATFLNLFTFWASSSSCNRRPVFAKVALVRTVIILACLAIIILVDSSIVNCSIVTIAYFLTSSLLIPCNEARFATASNKPLCSTIDFLFSGKVDCNLSACAIQVVFVQAAAIVNASSSCEWQVEEEWISAANHSSAL